jgi:DNA-binding CsgD family transcriptional regulator
MAPPPIAAAIWVCLPLVSGLCLLQCQGDEAPAARASQGTGAAAANASQGTDAAAANAPHGLSTAGSYAFPPVGAASESLRKKGRWKLIPHWWFGLSVFAVSLCIALPVGLSPLTALGDGQLGFATLSGLVLAVILVIHCVIFARRINLATFYRILCPLTVSGLFLIALPSPVMAFIGYGLVFAAQWVLYLSVWIYLAELCHRADADPVLVFVVGRVFFELGFLIAYLLGGRLPLLVQEGVTEPVFIVFAVAAFFVASTIFPINADDMRERSHAYPIGTDRGMAGRGFADTGSIPASSQDMMRTLLEQHTQRLALRHGLSPRESEIVYYLVRGYSLPSIRNELFIARSTIDTHVQHIYKKCGIHSRQELIALFEQTNPGTESP